MKRVSCWCSLVHAPYLTKVAAMQDAQAVSAGLLRGRGVSVEVVAHLAVDVRAHEVVHVGRLGLERHAAQVIDEAHLDVIVLDLREVALISRKRHPTCGIAEDFSTELSAQLISNFFLLLPLRAGGRP